MSDKLLIKKNLKDSFKKGEVVFNEGDKGNAMYIIKSGKVDVIKDTGKEEVVLATLEPKSFFGEMALFGDPSRSATIRAAEDTKMIVITKEILDSQFENVPEWFVSMLKTLVGRLRETNKRIKSRFRIGLEFSMLKTIYLCSEELKKSGSKDQNLSFKKIKTECCNLLALSENEFIEKMKSLMFVGLIRFSEPKDLIIIPDENKLKDFMAFLRDKEAREEEEEGSLDNSGPSDADVVFEKIYKLLYKKKL